MLSFAKQIDIYPVFPTDHSMGSKNFLRYIRSKITDKQCSLLSISASNNFQIECHGVFFETWDEFLCLNAYTVVSDHWQVSFSYKKVANYKRPTWLMVENACKQKKLIIIVSPAKEYLQQYASIIQSVLLFLLPKGHGIDVYAKATAAAQLFKVFYYPEVSCNFSKTMGVSDL